MRSAACFSKGCNTTVYVCERYVTWLRLARESTYKFAGLHHKGGSEKLRNVVSFVRLRKAEWWRRRFEESAAFDLFIWQLHLYISKNSAKLHSNHSDQDRRRIPCYFILTMASHVDISIRVPLNSSSVAPSSRASLLPHRPSLETVSTQPVSFSISRILGFEGNPFQPPAYSLPPGM